MMQGPPNELFAQIQQTRKQKAEGGREDSNAGGRGGSTFEKQPPPAGAVNPLAAMLQARNNSIKAVPVKKAASVKPENLAAEPKGPLRTGDGPFSYDSALDAFVFFADGETPDSFVPCLVPDERGNPSTDVLVPLAPCVYRMTDYTFAKKEPVAVQRCVLKLGVLRCLRREADNFNRLLRHRNHHETFEEEELGKCRFMELLSNCGVYQKVSELVLRRTGQVLDLVKQSEKKRDGKHDNNENPFLTPQVRVEGLEDFLAAIEAHCPELEQARKEIADTQTVSFYPGLGELFDPGSKLVCHPEGMEGSPLGCSCVQSWYAEDVNKATNLVKRRFVLVIEFVVSVGDELVFVAATDVYPEL